MLAAARKYWLISGFLLLIVVFTIAWLLLREEVNAIATISTALLAALGWAASIAQFIYHKSEKFFIKFNSCYLKLTNATTHWDFTIELRNCHEIEPIKVISDVVKHHSNQAMILHEERHKLVANLPGFTLDVMAQGRVPIEDWENVVLRISNLELPYRSFRNRIIDQIVPLLEDISKGVGADGGKYAAKISFSNGNPYFGYFLRKLELPRIVAFQCDLLETTAGNRKQNVRVYKNRLDIVADSPHALLSLALKYVAFSIQNLSEPRSLS